MIFNYEKMIDKLNKIHVANPSNQVPGMTNKLCTGNSTQSRLSSGGRKKGFPLGKSSFEKSFFFSTRQTSLLPQRLTGVYSGIVHCRLYPFGLPLRPPTLSLPVLLPSTLLRSSPIPHPLLPTLQTHLVVTIGAHTYMHVYLALTSCPFYCFSTSFNMSVYIHVSYSMY